MVATCSRDDFRAGRADWIANPLQGLPVMSTGLHASHHFIA